MRIKRFVAPDMRTALRMVREEQGPDAVILSNRPAEGGIEIVAATDYDESLVQQALRAAAPTLAPHSAPVVTLHAPRSPARERIAHIEPLHAAALVTEAAANAPALPANRADAMIAGLSSPAPQPARNGIAARARAVFRIGEAPAQPTKSETVAPTLAQLVSTTPADTRPAPEAPRLPAGDDFRALLARLAESEASNAREAAIEPSPVEAVIVETANDDAPAAGRTRCNHCGRCRRSKPPLTRMQCQSKRRLSCRRCTRLPPRIRARRDAWRTGGDARPDGTADGRIRARTPARLALRAMVYDTLVPTAATMRSRNRWHPRIDPKLDAARVRGADARRTGALDHGQPRRTDRRRRRDRAGRPDRRRQDHHRGQARRTLRRAPPRPRRGAGHHRHRTPRRAGATARAWPAPRASPCARRRGPKR